MAKERKTDKTEQTAETLVHPALSGWKEKIHRWIPLGILCVSVFCVLGAIHMLTENTVAEHQAAAEQAAAESLFPNATEIVFLYEIDGAGVYAAEQDGILLGVCVRTREKANGGVVEIMTAILPDGKTGGSQRISQTETVGGQSAEDAALALRLPTLDFAVIAAANGWQLPTVADAIPDEPDDAFYEMEENADGSIVFVDDFPEESEEISGEQTAPLPDDILPSAEKVKTVVVSSVPRVTSSDRLAGENRVIVLETEIIQVKETESEETSETDTTWIEPETEPETTVPETTVPETAVPDPETETDPIQETEPVMEPETTDAGTDSDETVENTVAEESTAETAEESDVSEVLSEDETTEWME